MSKIGTCGAAKSVLKRCPTAWQPVCLRHGQLTLTEPRLAKAADTETAGAVRIPGAGHQDAPMLIARVRSTGRVCRALKSAFAGLRETARVRIADLTGAAARRSAGGFADGAWIHRCAARVVHSDALLPRPARCLRAAFVRRRRTGGSSTNDCTGDETERSSAAIAVLPAGCRLAIRSSVDCQRTGQTSVRTTQAHLRRRTIAFADAGVIAPDTRPERPRSSVRTRAVARVRERRRQAETAGGEKQQEGTPGHQPAS